MLYVWGCEGVVVEGEGGKGNEKRERRERAGNEEDHLEGKEEDRIVFEGGIGWWL